jgi:methylmalonyl-CoA/ethylmalonyl-CoA epimerase
MKILGVDHIGIAVSKIDDYFPLYEKGLGLKITKAESIPDSNLKIAFLDLGNILLELIEPTSPDSTIAKFITKRGPGIHHFCIQVEDIEEALAHFNKICYEMIDNHPRKGEDGSRIAFISPKSFGGVLIELKQV